MAPCCEPPHIPRIHPHTTCAPAQHADLDDDDDDDDDDDLDDAAADDADAAADDDDDDDDDDETLKVCLGPSKDSSDWPS